MQSVLLGENSLRGSRLLGVRIDSYCQRSELTRKFQRLESGQKFSHNIKENFIKTRTFDK